MCFSDVRPLPTRPPFAVTFRARRERMSSARARVVTAQQWTLGSIELRLGCDNVSLSFAREASAPSGSPARHLPHPGTVASRSAGARLPRNVGARQAG